MRPAALRPSLPSTSATFLSARAVASCAGPMTVTPLAGPGSQCPQRPQFSAQVPIVLLLWVKVCSTLRAEADATRAPRGAPVPRTLSVSPPPPTPGVLHHGTFKEVEEFTARPGGVPTSPGWPPLLPGAGRIVVNVYYVCVVYVR